MSDEDTTDTTDQDDSAAQEALASAQEADQAQEAEDSELDPKIKAKIEKANREARNLRQRLRELEPLAKKFKDSEQASKTEAQKLSEQLAEAQVELQGLRVEGIRRDAALQAGLDPDLAEFITAADPEEALAQAKRLAKRTTPPEPPRGDFRQGTRTQPAQKQDKNDLLRTLAGYPQ